MIMNDDLRTWLSYCRFGTSSLGESFSSPAPGPINNECLLIMAADTDSSSYASLAEANQGEDWPRFKWVIKTGLLPAGKDQGHFRRVNKYVWAAFCEMYKGSGPAIKYEDEVIMPPSEEAPSSTNSTGDEAKSTDAAAAVDTKETEKSSKVGDDSVGANSPPPEDEVAVDPNRWQDSSTWVVDQSQDAFLIKVK